ncbi:hypothetical protein CEE37_09805 [candidate division LCP-89 bacterium B3_LCP]|uniref:Pyruvate/ketoisovalerate oxidoreductase catalytic domain-containing protein n=1 Tax=candidate division LCP-89 bacterium B3_LCP TaxID=2012998 RepID=A0A532UYJ2_UNCL8|nr:MAG: hypothetical protein CEE37_09805 [candidate division LCP-89 bacterium B3_LCP]
MEIKLCGVGGQGLGFAGRILGEAAIESGLHAAMTTSYGVESRGGMSTSDVIIDKDTIHFPEVRKPDVLLIMAEKGLKANLNGVHADTLVIFDPGTVTEEINSPGKKQPFHFLKMALKEFNNREAATIIGIGALVKITGVISQKDMVNAMKRCLPEKAHKHNLKAFQLGFDLP